MFNAAPRPQTNNSSAALTRKPVSRQQQGNRGTASDPAFCEEYPVRKGPPTQPCATLPYPILPRAWSARLPPLLSGTPLQDLRPLRGGSGSSRPNLASPRCIRRRRPRSSFPAALGSRKGTGRQRTEKRKGPAGQEGDGTRAMNGSANSLLDKEEHPLQLGESFERRPKAFFHTIRCEHHPVSLLSGPAEAATSSSLSSRSPPPVPLLPPPCSGSAVSSAALPAPAGEPALLAPLPAGRPRSGQRYLSGAPPSSPRFPPRSRRGFLLVKGRPLPAACVGLRSSTTKRVAARPLLLAATTGLLPPSEPAFPPRHPRGCVPAEVSEPGGQPERRWGRWMSGGSAGGEAV